jgi:membrane-associated phospholipid phosphatase
MESPPEQTFPRVAEAETPISEPGASPRSTHSNPDEELEIPRAAMVPPGFAPLDEAILPGDAPSDQLLLRGLEQAALSESDEEPLPLDWQDLDPRLSAETTPLFTFQDDLQDWWPGFVSDFRSTLSWRNVLVLGIGAGVSLGLREDADGEVRAWTARSPDRWGDGSHVLRQFGEFKWQVPVLLGGYSFSLWRQDESLHEFFRSTISAYTLTSLTTVAIKGIADTQRPSNEFEDGRFGFPSFHASSTFAIAANIETWYGWQAGLPAYTLAGLVGWSRIDQREHDLSDVVFGSILGYTIGKSVALSRLSAAESRWRMSPWFEANHQASGVSFDLRY